MNWDQARLPLRIPRLLPHVAARVRARALGKHVLRRVCRPKPAPSRWWPECCRCQLPNGSGGIGTNRNRRCRRKRVHRAGPTLPPWRTSAALVDSSTSSPLHELPATEIISVRFDVICRRLSNRFFLLWQQLDLELLHNGMGDFVLDGEDVGQIAIVAIGPDVSAVFPMDELSGHPNARPGFPHASFQNKVDPEVLRDLLHLDRFALVSKDGVSGDDEQTRHLGEVRDDVFGNAVAEIFLLRIAAHINKGKNGDRWPLSLLAG